MQVVHSLWSQPMTSCPKQERIKKQVVNLWCYALSVAYARKHNLPIRLYTDEQGKRLIGHLPYDSILPLNMPTNTPTSFWAAGKFKAYEQMQTGDVHIDGDVFLTESRCVEAIEQNLQQPFHIFAQNEETPTNCSKQFYNKIISLLNLFNISYDNIDFPRFRKAYNTGIISFGDNDFRNEYCYRYWQTIRQVTANKTLADVLRIINTAPDVVLEQQMLYETANAGVHNPNRTLLGTGKEIYKNASKIGYIHLLANAKEEEIQYIVKRVEEVNPDIYRTTQQVFEQIKA